MARILLIEDDDALRQMLRRVLEREGHEIHDVASGADAVHRADFDAFDLLITDIYMPDMDGIEVIQEVRARQPHLRILAISGVGTRGPANPLTDAAMLGAEATLPKPFTIEQLRESVRALLRG